MPTTRKRKSPRWKRLCGSNHRSSNGRQSDRARDDKTHHRGERAATLEKAIAAYEAALTATTREALPRDWAETHHNLALAYTDRIRGDRADNLEKAIAAFEAALIVFTREA